MYWRLNRIQYPVYNLGPGKRIGIWVQGCSIRCNGCISSSLWDSDGGKVVVIDKLVGGISAVSKQFDGVTITGGEPFDQYASMIAFAAYLKQKTSLNIYCYSGYTLASLCEKYVDGLFKKYLDYLVDGPYQKEQHDNCNTRGSTNQKMYQFIDGNEVLLENMVVDKRWSLCVGESNQIYLTGIPKEGELKDLENKFDSIGMKLRFGDV